MDKTSKQERIMLLTYALRGAESIIQNIAAELKTLGGVGEGRGGGRRRAVIEAEHNGHRVVKRREKRKAVWTPRMRRAARARMEERWKKLGKAGFNLGSRRVAS